jgi:hypothetical protein
MRDKSSLTIRLALHEISERDEPRRARHDRDALVGRFTGTGKHNQVRKQHQS